MRADLRQVEFSLVAMGYIPDLSPNEEKEMQEDTRKRTGYFHRWVEDVDTSKDIPYVKTMALVEDSEDGRVHMVEYSNIRFKD